MMISNARQLRRHSDSDHERKGRLRVMNERVRRGYRRARSSTNHPHAHLSVPLQSSEWTRERMHNARSPYSAATHHRVSCCCSFHHGRTSIMVSTTRADLCSKMGKGVVRVRVACIRREQDVVHGDSPIQVHTAIATGACTSHPSIYSTVH